MLSCCGEFNDALATYILQNREAVLERNREIVFRNMAIAQEWILTRRFGSLTSDSGSMWRS